MTHLEYWNFPAFLLSPLAVVGLLLLASAFLSGSDFGVFKVPSFPPKKRILASCFGGLLVFGLFLASQPLTDDFESCQGNWILEQQLESCLQQAEQRGMLLFHIQGRKVEEDDEWKVLWVEAPDEEICWRSFSGQSAQNHTELAKTAEDLGYYLVWQNQFNSFWKKGPSFQSLWHKKGKCE